MKTILHFIVLSALRDKLFTALLVLLLLLLGISSALSETAMLEKAEMHLAMSAGLTRIVVNIGIMLFVCFHIRTLYDTKEMDVLLSRPVSRTKVVIGLWAGFAVVASLLIVIDAGLLFFFNLGGGKAFAVWTFSFLCEGWVVVAIATFAALSNKSFVSSVLICFSFYALARLMAFFVATAHARISVESVALHKAMRYVIDTISVVIPRLDLYADTDWLVYGLSDTASIGFFAAQTVIFVPFMLAIALIDFKRKQF
jgi:ABC-type Na+ efflux pump permease subunit